MTCEHCERKDERLARVIAIYEKCGAEHAEMLRELINLRRKAWAREWTVSLEGISSEDGHRLEPGEQVKVREIWE